MENVKTKARKAGGLACQEHILKVTAAEPDDFTSRDLHGGTRDPTPECCHLTTTHNCAVRPPTCTQ